MLMTVVTVTGSLCSCSNSKINEKEVFDAADELGKYIVKRDYYKIDKLTSDSCERLDNMMTLNADDPTDGDRDVRHLIADSLDYTVDKDSFQLGEGGRYATVDIVFEYLDYESAIPEGKVYQFYSQVEDDLGASCGYVEDAVTFIFEKHDGQVICKNITDICRVFPYYDLKINFALPLEEYVNGVTFEGAVRQGTEQCLFNADCIEARLDLKPGGEQLVWDYYTILEWDGGICDDKTPQTVRNSTYLSCTYTQELDYVSEGEYTVSFYTLDDQLLGSGTVNVVISSNLSPWSGSGDIYIDDLNPSYICPEDGVIEFTDTDLVLDLPDDIVCLDGYDVLELGVPMYDDILSSIYFFATTDERMADVYAEQLSYGAYDCDECLYYVDTLVDEMYDIYSTDADCEVSTSEYTIAGRTYTIHTVTVDFGYGVLYLNYVVIGDEDTSYLLRVYSVYDNRIEEIMDAISAN